MVPLISLKTFIEEVKSGGIDTADFAAKALAEARGIQERYSPFITINDRAGVSPGKGALAGLPLSVKDCICTAGIRTTAGSKILESYIPPVDATSVARLRAAGGMVIGKTAQDEFGFGTFSTNCAYTVPKNPYDTSRSCGGSSGGAACVAAAAKLPHIAIAESTGGSITAPAAFTGTVGLTPTYGRISRNGLIDYSNSMDKIGAIGKSAYDVALALSVMAGRDPSDSTCLPLDGMDFTGSIGKGVKGMRIGVAREYFEGVDRPVAEQARDSVERLRELGADVGEVSLPLTGAALPAYYIIAMSEASTNLARYSGLRYGAQAEVEGSFSDYFSKVRSGNLGEEAKRRILLGTYARAAGFRDAFYIKALKVRRRIIDEFRRAFADFDVIAAPSMPTIAPRFSDIERLSPIEAYRMDRLTTAPNLAGIPTISVPAGRVEGMPIGLQMMGDHLQEGKILAAAAALEGLDGD